MNHHLQYLAQQIRVAGESLAEAERSGGGVDSARHKFQALNDELQRQIFGREPDPLHRKINQRGAQALLNQVLDQYRADAWEEAIKSHGLKDHQIREMINELNVVAQQYAGAQQLRSRIAGVVLKHLRRGDMRHDLLRTL